MAEFEIIGDEHTAGGEEEMDEATRQFLEEERRQLEAMGVNSGFGDNDEGNAENDFGGFEGQDQDAAADEGFGGDDDFGSGEQHDVNAFDGQEDYEPDQMTNGEQYGSANPFDGGENEDVDTTDAYAAFSGIQEEIEEPDSVRKWRTDFAARIAQIDARSAEKKEDMLAKAKEDLAAFYTNYEHQKETTAAQNREAEASQQASKEEPTGADWEQVANMLDFNPKTQVGQRDKSRMRGMLLQLKQTPLVR